MPFHFGLSRRQLLVIIFSSIVLFLFGTYLEIGMLGTFLIVLLLSVVLRFYNLIRFYQRTIDTLQGQFTGNQAQ